MGGVAHKEKSGNGKRRRQRKEKTKATHILTQAPDKKTIAITDHKSTPPKLPESLGAWGSPKKKFCVAKNLGKKSTNRRGTGKPGRENGKLIQCSQDTQR